MSFEENSIPSTNLPDISSSFENLTAKTTWWSSSLFYDIGKVDKEAVSWGQLKYRRDRAITQKELARQIGIDPTTLSRLERNKENRVFRAVNQRVEAVLTSFVEKQSLSLVCLQE